MRTIKCDKEAISALLTTLLTKRLEFYFGRDELLDFRLWQVRPPRPHPPLRLLAFLILPRHLDIWPQLPRRHCTPPMASPLASPL